MSRTILLKARRASSTLTPRAKTQSTRPSLKPLGKTNTQVSDHQIIIEIVKSLSLEAKLTPKTGMTTLLKIPRCIILTPPLPSPRRPGTWHIRITNGLLNQTSYQITRSRGVSTIRSILFWPIRRSSASKEIKCYPYMANL